MEHLSRWLDRPDRTLLSDATLRLARHVPETHAALDHLLDDPIARALAGLQEIDPTAFAGDLADAVRATVAAVEGGAMLDAAWLSALEARAASSSATDEGEGEGEGRMWWPLAAHAHARCVPARERAGRMALSEQDVPYVFPGELHPLQIEVFAVGDAVIPALHVDWARKLTGLAAEALGLDLQHRGLWAWPLLQALPPQPLVGALQRALRRRQRLPPGGAGLAVAYLAQLGQPSREVLGGADGLVLDLAQAGQRHTHG